MENKTLEEIRDSNTQDLIDGLRGQKFSLLKSMGFKKLRAEMVLTGLVCRTIVFLTGLTRAVRKAGDAGVKSSAKAFAKQESCCRLLPRWTAMAPFRTTLAEWLSVLTTRVSARYFAVSTSV
jgi:hypothetical protein